MGAVVSKTNAFATLKFNIYFDYTTIKELISLVESVNKVYAMYKSIVLANKYA